VELEAGAFERINEKLVCEKLTTPADVDGIGGEG
jgi:hypothetical protein